LATKLCYLDAGVAINYISRVAIEIGAEVGQLSVSHEYIRNLLFITKNEEAYPITGILEISNLSHFATRTELGKYSIRNENSIFNRVSCRNFSERMVERDAVLDIILGAVLSPEFDGVWWKKGRY